MFESKCQIKTPNGAFNPSICEFEGKTLIAYRVDQSLPDVRDHLGRPWHVPRVWLAELMADLSIENPVEVMDYAEDGRLWEYGGVLHCSHSYSPRPNDAVLKNRMANARIARDGSVARFWIYAYGEPPQKNWQFFECEYELYAIYCMNPWLAKRDDESEPFTILRLPGHSTRPKDIYRSNAYPKLEDWRLRYPKADTPPIRIGDSYWGFFHSWTRKTEYPGGQLPHKRKFYTVGAYRFSAGPPFRLQAYTPEPILEARGPGKLIYYPCGAIYKEGIWKLSYGLNDNQCWLGTIRHDKLAAAMEKIA